LDAVAAIQAAWSSHSLASDIPLTSGLVGALGWNVIREIERLPQAKAPVLDFPTVSLSMIQDLVVVDHLSAKILFVANVFVEGQSEAELLSQKQAAQLRIEDLKRKLAAPHAPFVASIDFELEPTVKSNQTREHFLNAVELAKEHVRQGDVFQVVLSQNFSTALDANPLTLYRLLRALNPSPYMYLLNGADSRGEFTIVGSSPESLVTVSGSDVVTHPIAGSRPRGKDWESDQRHEAELQGDRKEIAEHLMLVDLARNDLLRVCQPDSVAVTEFMQVHRFSHIMHLVSTVEGKLRAGQTPIDVFRATFPAGTLSGAPKPRALEIITELEPTDRGLYGGVCGYFDFAGNSDLAIAIRTAFVRDGHAIVQAGAGIVLDSDPVSEFEETKSKARAVLRSIAAANNAKSV
jgi:anthranilate synthase component 1